MTGQRLHVQATEDPNATCPAPYQDFRQVPALIADTRCTTIPSETGTPRAMLRHLHWQCPPASFAGVCHMLLDYSLLMQTDLIMLSQAASSTAAAHENCSTNGKADYLLTTYMSTNDKTASLK